MTININNSETFVDFDPNTGIIELDAPKKAKWERMLERQVYRNPWLNEDERARLWLELEAAGETEPEVEYITHRGYAYGVDKLMDEGRTHSRGFDPEEDWARAIVYEAMEEEDYQDVHEVDLEEMEASWISVMNDFEMEHGVEEESWTTTERDRELEVQCHRPIDSRCRARVEKDMEGRSKTPGLGYFLNGGRVCFKAAKEYKEIKETLLILLARGRLALSTARRDKNDAAIRGIIGLGQDRKRQLALALIKVKATHLYFGRVYDPRAYYTKKRKIEGLRGVSKEAYYSKR